MAAQKTIPGCDVASFQGPPATWAAEAGAIRYAAVKVTELKLMPDGSLSHYVSPTAGEDWSYLASQKLGRIAYLFAHPGTDPADTVTFFGQQLEILGLADGDGIMVDLEVTDGRAPAEVNTWAAQVTTALEKAYDRVPLLYTYLDFALEGNCVSLGHLPLFMSDPSSPKGRPRVPAPWKTWTLHQWSTSAPIDRDVAKFPTLAAMQKALGKRQPKPPEDEPMQIAHSGTLAELPPVQPNRLPVTLAWHFPGARSPEEAVRPGAGVMISDLNVHAASGSALRFTLAEVLPDGKPGKSAGADYGQGGWTQFTKPFTAVKGAAYVLTVTNYGTAPVKLTQGTWEIVR